MTMLILYNLNPDLRYHDYIECASQAGLTCEAAEVHTDSKTVWFKAATFDGKDLGSTSELEWAEKGFFSAFTQCARDFLRAKYDLSAAVNNDVVVPTRRLSSVLILKSPLIDSEDDVLYLDASKFDC
ncbi:hypothetical protein [Pseudomonas sp. C2B4]|uniref:hypothetical protein n=1 Tax=Pseudomonas sp. C2B4 TaxID=2735270 RepID=UPI0015868E57|nr:hypothetical protein [Pseudomonas sp. C2B4]NUU38709.1 hypothetical protein [Pseudomonas sp. C2B4]